MYMCFGYPYEEMLDNLLSSISFLLPLSSEFCTKEGNYNNLSFKCLEVEMWFKY